jgi:hypothetical protein
MPPVLRTDLLAKAVIVGDAGFGRVKFEVAAIARRPRGLIVSPVKAAKDRLSGVAFLVLAILRPVELVVANRPVIDLIFQFPAHLIVGLVEKSDKPVNLVAGFLAESPYRLERFFWSDGGRIVKRTSGLRWPF